MFHLKVLSGFIILLAIFTSCNSIPDKEWTSAVPGKTPFIVIPEDQASLSEVLQSPFIPFLDDITFSAVQLVSRVDSAETTPIPVKAILLYPGTGNHLQPVWITSAPEGYTESLRSRFYRSFSQNQYRFHGTTIHRLHMQDRILYACQLHDLLLISESSLGIEDAVRTYLGRQPAAEFAEGELEPGSVVMNTPSLDKWVEQLARVIHRPSIIDSFTGTRPAVLKVNNLNTEEKQSGELEFTGNLPLDEAPRSSIVAAFSETNSPVQLDRYISSNAAAFGIFRLSPTLAPPTSVPDTTSLDSLLMQDRVRYAEFAKSLRPEFALVTYAESGFLSTGEHLFIRSLSDRQALRSELADLAGEGLIRRSGNTYVVNSWVLSELIGSEMCNFRDFYLTFTGDVVVISKRRGLAEVVASDRSRRRTIYYEENYMDIRAGFPDEVSGLVMLNSEFEEFISPFLAPDNYLTALTSQFDYLTLTTRLDQSGENLAFNLKTYISEETNVPYREQWLFPTGGSELSGPPVLADIGGSPRDEIIFATRSGSIYALAADGTVVLQLSTEEDTPVGSPVVYDWYANNQNIILVAAGNKIYGWNDAGEPLPRFPFELDETITTPLSVTDINRNGLPEALVATADRRLHALDGRGSNLEGWPLTTNAPVRSKPLVDYYQGSLSVLAFSENAVHAWYPDGVPRSGFPRFVNASLNGSPVIHKNNILGAAADGYLYSIGSNILFADSLNVYSNISDSSGMGAVYVSSSSLTGTPAVHTMSVNTEENSFSGPMILTMSNNGSVFLLSENGRLRFTQSMGQPSAPGTSPLVTDINSDNQNDIVALADYGRLYAWELASGERNYSALPSSRIEHYIIEDMDGDGFKELIAQTSEGVRCWTIYGER